MTKPNEERKFEKYESETSDFFYCKSTQTAVTFEYWKMHLS